jgi:putative membrane protein
MQLEMARTRTLLAMDRTLLAWVRTSISLCAFGFTLAKFVHTLILSGTLKGVEATYPKHVGIVLMMLGIGGLLGGAFDYWRWLRRLGKTLEMPRATITMVVALMLACISLTLMISMIRDID